MSLSRYFAPAVLAASLGAAALAAPAPAQAQSDDLIRVLVNIADVVMRGNTPYYRHGDYSQDDRLIAQRDQYGRVVYYRTMPRYDGYRQDGYRSQPPYGNAYGYHRNRAAPLTGQRQVKCNKKGKCTVQYYDPRYDRDGRYGYNTARYDRYDRYDRRDDRRWRDDD